MHSYFQAVEGLGKTSCARILAKALNCETGPTPSPCGVCNACSEISAGRSIDVFEIDGASNNSVEQIRDIRESVKFVPTAGRRKIYIIDEVHMLSVSAFNALLKTLEEPPEHILFIFATTEPHKIPETILSRCQRFDFRRIPESEIVQALAKIATEESVDVSETVLAEIAREARGGMRDSLSLLDQVISFCGQEIDDQAARQVLGVAGRAQLTEMFLAMTQRNGQQVLELVRQQHEQGADLEKYAHRFVDFMRDLLVVKICPEPQRLLDQEAEELQRMIRVVDSLQPADLHRMLGTMLRHVDELSRSAFPKLRLEMALLEICEQGPTLPIAQLLDAVQKARSAEPELVKKKPELSNRGSGGRDVSIGHDTPSLVQMKPTDLKEASPLKEVLETQDVAAQSITQSQVQRHTEKPSEKAEKVEDRPPRSTADISKSKSKTSLESEQKSSAFKKRPSKRSGGYDDFSGAPPIAWTEAECPNLEVKPRKRGALGDSGLLDSRTFDLSQFVSAGETDQDRYRDLLLAVKSTDTFLASELEQNSHIITLNEQGVEIAIEHSENSLIERANERFAQMFGGMATLIRWTRCDQSDDRLSQETIYEERKRHAEQALARRKEDAESHEAVRLTKEILGGQVLDVLPRER